MFEFSNEQLHIHVPIFNKNLKNTKIHFIHYYENRNVSLKAFWFPLLSNMRKTLPNGLI